MEKPKAPENIRVREPGCVILLFLVASFVALAAFGEEPEPLPPVEEPAPDWPPVPEEEGEAKPPESTATILVEESEPVKVADDPAPIGPYLSAAGWCSLRSGTDAEDAPGCEAGIAAALYSRRLGESEYHVSAVGIIGERSVGVGVAWCRARTCAGVGVVAVRDDAGIDTLTLAPAVGATWRPGR